MRSPDHRADPAALHDVVVVGAGPAGRALAGACASRGLHTALVDPAPARAWRITYGAFTAELIDEVSARWATATVGSPASGSRA